MERDKELKNKESQIDKKFRELLAKQKSVDSKIKKLEKAKESFLKITRLMQKGDAKGMAAEMRRFDRDVPPVEDDIPPVSEKELVVEYKHDIDAIRGLIREARERLNSKDPLNAEKILGHIEELFKQLRLGKDEKTVIRYDILELKTDIDLALLNGLV